MPTRPVIGMNQTTRSMVETVDGTPNNGGSESRSSEDKNIMAKESTVTPTGDSETGNESNATTEADPAATDEEPIVKAVSWNPKIVKRYTLRRQDMPADERESYWYTKKDDKLVLMTAKVTVKMIMKGEPFDNVDYCSRGLEGKTLIESKKRARNKRKVLTAVLMEQELQRLEGVKNPEQVRKAAFKHTQEICERASHQAIEDEQEVQEYLDDVRSFEESLSNLKFEPPQSTDSLASAE